MFLEHDPNHSANGAPYTQQHQAHELFTSYVKSCAEEFTRAPSRILVNQLLSYTVIWLKNHILEHDRPELLALLAGRGAIDFDGHLVADAV